MTQKKKKCISHSVIMQSGVCIYNFWPDAVMRLNLVFQDEEKSFLFPIFVFCSGTKRNENNKKMTRADVNVARTEQVHCLCRPSVCY